MHVITRSMWRAVGIGLVVAAGLWALNQAKDLVVIVVVATFLALAIVPAVDGLVRRWGWSRGTAVIAVMLGVFLTIVLLIGFLVPAMVDVAGKLGQEVPSWLDDARKSGLDLPLLKESDAQLLADAENWLKKNGGTHVLSQIGRAHV